MARAPQLAVLEVLRGAHAGEVYLGPQGALLGLLLGLGPDRACAEPAGLPLSLSAAELIALERGLA